MKENEIYMLRNELVVKNWFEAVVVLQLLWELVELYMLLMKMYEVLCMLKKHLHGL